MDLSVIICTLNRADELRATLTTLLAQPLPEGAELIVVDNGSTDATSEVITSFQKQHPVIRVDEPVAGLSNARNAGLQSATGRWALYIDDDVNASPQLLPAYLRAIQRYPDAVVLGGGIEPVLLGDRPPAWLTRGLREVRDAYAGRDAHTKDQPIKAHTPPYGANFAIRVASAGAAPFDPSLGRHPDHPARGGEENEVIRALLRKGIGYWVAGANVEHRIAEGRQSPSYLRRYFSQAGAESALRFAQTTGSDRRKTTVRVALRWLAHSLALRLGALLGITRRRARDLRESAWHAGYLNTHLRSIKEP